MSEQKIILGLVGEMAAGKSTVTQYLKEKHDAVTFRFSDTLRDLLNRLHLEHSRANMQVLSTLLRQAFGDDILSKNIALDVTASSAPFIITEGIRRPSDIAYLKALPGFRLVAITADARTRYERMTKRSENPDDQSKTWETFQAESNQESESKIREIMGSADATIDNNGSTEDLYKQIDMIIEKL